MSRRGGRARIAWAWVILAMAALCPAARGELVLTLPERGLYRPGEYLAVAVEGAGGADVLRIEADGALPTVVHRPADRVVAPLLVIGPGLSNLRASAGDAAVQYDGPLGLADAPSESIIGPSGSIISETAYTPTFGWRPGWAWSIRRTILAVGIGLTVLVVAASLLPRRRASALAIALVLAAGVAGAVVIRQVYPPVHSARGLVLVRGPQRVQADEWSFQTSPRPTRAAFLWRERTYPIFFSRRHRETLAMELRCAPDGRPLAFSYDLPAGGSVVFLTRLSDAPTVGTSPFTRSKIADLAAHLYRLPATASIAPPDATDQWFGGIVLEVTGS